MSGERQVKVLYDADAIAKRVEELARDIAALKPKDLLVAAIQASMRFSRTTASGAASSCATPVTSMISPISSEE